MKVKILLKNIKEGVGKNGQPYCIKSLYACVSTKDDANALAVQAIADGVPADKIQEVIKSKEYEGATSYAFGLNCSHFTFDRVDRFGVLDCKIEFVVNKDGFINPKIQVIDKTLENGKTIKVENIFGYEAPEQQEEEVDGWASPAPDIKPKQPIGDGTGAEPNPIEPFGVDQNSLNPNPTDLPF